MVRHRKTHYRVEFIVAAKPAHHVARVTLDGNDQPERFISLTDDGGTHQVTVTLGVE